MQVDGNGSGVRGELVRLVLFFGVFFLGGGGRGDVHVVHSCMSSLSSTRWKREPVLT